MTRQQPSTAAFRAARELLQQLREDYQAAAGRRICPAGMTELRRDRANSTGRATPEAPMPPGRPVSW